MGLVKETKARGWWHAYGDAIPEGFDVYIGLEEAASHVSWYESELVPGLLQTELRHRVHQHLAVRSQREGLPRTDYPSDKGARKVSTIDLSGAAWRKSSRSNADYSCVEVAGLDGGHRAVRDSKNPSGSALIVTPAEWAAFTAGIRAGEFD